MKNYTIFCAFAFTYAASSWTEYKEEIDAFRTILLKETNITEDILNKVPKFGDFAEEVAPKLYDKLTIKGGGQDARVWVGKSLTSRPNVGIAQGQVIAIRGARIGTFQEKSSAVHTLKNFVSAQNMLRNPDSPITEFFPAFYGTYEAKGETQYHPKQALNFQEMEAIDATLADQYVCGSDAMLGGNLQKKVTMSDCVVFEFCLGEWAGAYFAKIGSSDAKVVNAGVKKVDHSRSYQIRGRTYIIPKTELMPKRIDLGGAGTYMSTTLLNSYSCSLMDLSGTFRQSNRCQTTSAAQEFMKDLAKKREGSIFDAFDAFYEKLSCKAAHGDEQNHAFVWPEIK